MNKGICLFLLFTGLSSCAVLEKNKLTEVVLNNSSLLQSEVTDETFSFAYMRTEAPLDSVLVQISFKEDSPDNFVCHMIKGKSPYPCEPIMQDKWKLSLQKNTEKKWMEMTAKAYVVCNNITYRISASYSGVMNINPGTEPH